MTTNLRKLTAAGQRISTGPVQFDDQWPGVFVRGDDALVLADMLRHGASDTKSYWLDRDFPRTPEFERFIKKRIEAMDSWADLFQTCEVKREEPVA